MDTYASHQQLLISAALQTTGPMVEMGCGDYSTPLLAEIAHCQGRSFEVFTSDKSWGSRYSNLCKVNYVSNWNDFTYPTCGLTFLDNSQYVRDRKLHVPKLLKTSDIVVCHDMGGENEWGAQYFISLDKNPPTIAVSNYMEISLVKQINPVKTYCVYKTGGDYTAEYVHRLYQGIYDNTTLPFEFICFTDSDEDLPGSKIALQDDLPGWWSKIEMFKEHVGRVVYFDLDTMIVGNIDDLLCYEGPVAMLKDFCNSELASGVMVWNSPLQFMYRKADLDYIRNHPEEWDQKFISGTLKNAKWNVDIIQGIIKTYSYKLHCKNGVPNDAKIVCFHGKPRPHEINWKI